jgi:hypothetical protein
MIPKAQQLDSMPGQTLGARLVAKLSDAIIMPAAIEFDRHLCSRTIEIENVRVETMLTPEFVAREIPVP